MKLTNDKIAAMVSSVLRGGKSYRSHDLIHPEREWFIGVLCFVFLALGAGWWAASLYMRFVDPTRLLPEEVTSESVTFRPAQVEAALKALEMRKERYQAAEAILQGDKQSVPLDNGEVLNEAATSSEGVPAVEVFDSVSVPDDAETEVFPDVTEVDSVETNVGGDEGVPMMAI